MPSSTVRFSLRLWERELKEVEGYINFNINGKAGKKAAFIKLTITDPKSCLNYTTVVCSNSSPRPLVKAESTA